MSKFNEKSTYFVTSSMVEFNAGKNKILVAAITDCKLKSAIREPKNSVFRIQTMLDIVLEANFIQYKYFLILLSN